MHTHTHTLHPHFQALIWGPVPPGISQTPRSCAHRLGQVPVTSVPFALLLFLTAVLSTGTGKLRFCLVIDELLIYSFSSRQFPDSKEISREAVGREKEPRPRSGVLPVPFWLL